MKNTTLKILQVITILVLCSQNLLAQTHSIGYSDINFYDGSRSRNIPATVYYPAVSNGANTAIATSAYKYPVVVFGHGLGLPVDIYKPLWERLVPLGFIVALPKTESGSGPSFTDFATDMKYLLDTLKKCDANSGSFFYQKVHTNGAIGGHSMGGGCSMLATSDNTIATCVFNFSAAEISPSPKTASKKITIPLLMFAGEKDCAVPPSYQKAMYDASPANCKAIVTLNGADHCQYALPNANCQGAQASCGVSATITESEQQQRTLDILELFLRWQLFNDYPAGKSYGDMLKASANASVTSSCASTSVAMTRTDEYKVYPSPASDVLYIHKATQGKAAISIYSTTGIKVKEATLNNKENKIDIQGLGSGVYYYSIKDESKQHIYKDTFTVTK